MPSAAKIEKQPSTEIQGQEPLKQVQSLVEKKIRNLEKRKTRLEQLQEEFKSGKDLNEDQKKAVSKYEGVIEILDFFKEFSKNVTSIFQEAQKVTKKAAKKEQSEKKEQELERLKTIFLYQNLLSTIEDAKVNNDFSSGTNGATQLSAEQLKSLEELNKTIALDRNSSTPFTKQIEVSAGRLTNLVEGRSKEAVKGASYKDLKETLELINNTGYFDKNENPEIQEDNFPVESQAEFQAQPDSAHLQLQNSVNFIQESILVAPGMERDPAIISVVSSQGPFPNQYIDPHDLPHVQVPKYDAAPIPTQTFTNTTFAGYGAGYGNAPINLPNTLVNPMLNANMGQLMPQISQEIVNQSEIPAYEQNDYSTDQMRTVSSQDKIVYGNGDDNYAQGGGFRSRGRGNFRGRGGDRPNGYNSRGGRGRDERRGGNDRGYSSNYSYGTNGGSYADKRPPRENNYSGGRPQPNRGTQSPSYIVKEKTPNLP